MLSDHFFIAVPSSVNYLRVFLPAGCPEVSELLRLEAFIDHSNKRTNTSWQGVNLLATRPS
jgi:hypothetical protein